MEPSISEIVRELHGDLARKYRIHKEAIERVWRSLDGPKRAKCLKDGAADGAVLQHSQDKSLGVACKLVPELNLRDIAEPGSDFALRHLKHRATEPLSQQYRLGVDGGLGDHAFIAKMMSERGLEFAHSFKDCYTLFLDEETYGNSIEMTSRREEVLTRLAPAMRAQLVVPQSMGELILQRQMCLLQCFNLLIQDILQEGSGADKQKIVPKKRATAQSKAQSRLTFAASQPKLTLVDVSNSAREQQAALQDFLDLIWTEPLVLSQSVAVWFLSQPEHVADERGRIIPAHTDKFISPALYEVVQNATRCVFIWDYINRLLQHLQSPDMDKAYRSIVLQELANACIFEFTRVQSVFKRYLQMGSGAKWFKRISNAKDNSGQPRVTIKGNINDLLRTDAQLHYALRLCQPETTPSKAVDWLKKLSDLHRTHPLEREKLLENEIDSLADLAVIVSFIEDLSTATSIPSLSRKHGQTFATELQAVDGRIAQLKPGIDLHDYAVPIDILLQDGMAERALTALDKYACDGLGTTMRSQYQHMIVTCMNLLSERHRKIKAQEAESRAERPLGFQQTTEQSSPLPQPQGPKEKTRGANAATDSGAAPASTMDMKGAPASPEIHVHPATAKVFGTIFSKSRARGSVDWSAFEIAMAALGFSVMPKYGSVYTFSPPSKMGATRSLIIHRPHGSAIEGHRLLYLARRLRRVYGWSGETFQEA
ncbi:hypothetical protein S40293_04828 [Stachybotrys chartarum IBT 40293]|nr:hypothetical protein S40293_04828 [Stachybotrys chartarum IBT 40293]